MPEPLDKKLYNSVREEAKERFDVWPSAYASGWVVQEYKRRGGKYHRAVSSHKSALRRWFKEKWVDACRWPEEIPCGRTQSVDRKYPYCRPSVRVSPKTPQTVREISRKELRRRCKQKRRSPHKRVLASP